MNADNITIREPDEIRQSCARKPRPVQVSPHFQAILGCLLGEDWTTPRLIEMQITPDGHMLAAAMERRRSKPSWRIGRPHQEHPRSCPGRRTRRRRDRLSRSEGSRDQEAAVKPSQGRNSFVCPSYPQEPSSWLWAI